MKNLRTLIAIIAIVLISTISYGQKLGHIPNAMDLVTLMPDFQSKQKSLETYATQLDAQYKSMMNDYQTKGQAFLQADQAGTMTELVKTTKQKELENLQSQIVQFETDAQQKIAAKENELFAPMIDKIRGAIKQVGDENGFDYIFDLSTGGFVFAKETLDVTSLVKTKLGL